MTTVLWMVFWACLAVVAAASVSAALVLWGGLSSERKRRRILLEQTAAKARIQAATQLAIMRMFEVARQARSSRD